MLRTFQTPLVHVPTNSDNDFHRRAMNELLDQAQYEKIKNDCTIQNMSWFILIVLTVFNYTEQHKKRPMHFSLHFRKSAVFSDIARYDYNVRDSRLPDALICF